MSPLEQQLASLTGHLKQLRDAIPVDMKTKGLSIEPHSPKQGLTYTRLRAPKGEKLFNGNRTMTLKAEDAVEWKQKIYARNQQAKILQCLKLIEQAAAIAQSVTWDFGDAEVIADKVEASREKLTRSLVLETEDNQLERQLKTLTPNQVVELVNKIEKFTLDQFKYVPPESTKPRNKAIVHYVLKNAKGATPMNRTVHAISQARPETGRWYGQALCGEKPKVGSWGWDIAPDDELSCPKCAVKLKALGIGL